MSTAASLVFALFQPARRQQVEGEASDPESDE